MTKCSFFIFVFIISCLWSDTTKKKGHYSFSDEDLIRIWRRSVIKHNFFISYSAHAFYMEQDVKQITDEPFLTFDKSCRMAQCIAFNVTRSPTNSVLASVMCLNNYLRNCRTSFYSNQSLIV